jgi:predicted heme/steroid binding protein
MLRLTREELRKFNGRGGRPAYIACSGRIYEVTGSQLWEDGLHMEAHSAGEDLTSHLPLAPHGGEMLERYPQVGELVG